MEEIVNYVLKYFGITFDDLKPSNRPKPNSIRARVIITTFLKHKGFRNPHIVKFLHTKDTSNVPSLIKKYTSDVYPELKDLFIILEEKFKNIEIPIYENLVYRKCRCCGEKKQSNIYYNKFSNGKYRQTCIQCDENKIIKKKENEIKRKIEKEKLAKEKQRIKEIKLKDKLLERESKIQKISAKREFNRIQKEKEKEKKKINLEEGRARQKNKEQELLKNGSRFVKSGIRAYVLR